MKKLLLGFAAAMFAFAAIADYVPLANTVRKLKANKALKVAVVGDSIGYGQRSGSVSLQGVAYATRSATNPNGMPKANPMSYARFFTDYLKKIAAEDYSVADSNIDTFYSVWGGATTKSAFGYFAQDIVARRPDLLLFQVWNSTGEALRYAEAMLRELWAVSPETDVILFSVGGCFADSSVYSPLVTKYGIPWVNGYGNIDSWFGQFGTFHSNDYYMMADGKISGTRGYLFSDACPHVNDEGYTWFNDNLATGFTNLLAAAASAEGDCVRVAPEGTLENDPISASGVFCGNGSVISPATLVAAGLVDSEKWTATINEVADSPRDTYDRATSDKLTAKVADATITTNVTGRFVHFRGCSNMKYSIDGVNFTAVSDNLIVNLTNGTEAANVDVSKTLTLKASAANGYINEFYLYSAGSKEIPAVTTKHRYSIKYFARVAELHYHDWHLNDTQVIPHPLSWVNVFRDETYGDALTAPGESVIGGDFAKNGTFLGWVEPDSVTWNGSERQFTTASYADKKIYAAGESIDVASLGRDLTLVAAYSEGPLSAACARTVKASFVSDATTSGETIDLLDAPAANPTVTLPALPTKQYFVANGWKVINTDTVLAAGSQVSLDTDTEYIVDWSYDATNLTGIVTNETAVQVDYYKRIGDIRKNFDSEVGSGRCGTYGEGDDVDGWPFECNGHEFNVSWKNGMVKAKVSNSPSYWKYPTFYGTVVVPVKASELGQIKVAYRYEPADASVSAPLTNQHANIKLFFPSVDGFTTVTTSATSTNLIELGSDKYLYFNLSPIAGNDQYLKSLEFKFYDVNYQNRASNLSASVFGKDAAFSFGKVTFGEGTIAEEEEEKEEEEDTPDLGDVWVYDAENNTVTNGAWTFAATVKSSGLLKIGSCSAYPATPSPLDFSKGVKKTDGTVYHIVELSTALATTSSRCAYGDSTPTDAGLAVSSLTLPNDGYLTTIGNGAFSRLDNCTAVANIIPDSVTKLGLGAFVALPVKADVRIASVADIGSGTFHYAKIASVWFGSALKTIDGWYNSGAFQQCTEMTNMTFDTGITGAKFTGWQSQCESCTKLEGTLDLRGFSKLTFSPFSGCKVDKVLVGSNVTEIATGFFNGMTKLSEVRFAGDVPATLGTPVFGTLSSSQVITSVVESADAQIRTNWTAKTSGGKLTDISTWSPDYVGDSAYSKRFLIIEDYEEEEGGGGGEEKKDLGDVWVYDAYEGVITNGAWKFQVIISGTDITVGAHVANPSVVSTLDFTKKVTDGTTDYTIVKMNPAFNNDEAGKLIGELRLPANGLTNISDNAFNNCTALTNIVNYLPDSVTRVGLNSFYKCPAKQELRVVGISHFGTQGNWGAGSSSHFSNNAFNSSGITRIVFGPGLKEINDWANGPFSSCKSLTNVTFDAATTGAKFSGCREGGFYGCSALAGTVDLSGFVDLTYLGTCGGNARIFGGTAITKVILGEGLQSLHVQFFDQATKLKEVVFNCKPGTGGFTFTTNNPDKHDDINGKMFGGLAATQAVIAKIREEDVDAWKPYAANETINAVDSTFSEDFAGENYPKRYLIYDGGDEPYGPLGEWIYDDAAGIVSNEFWAFSAEGVLTSLQRVGACVRYPETLSLLDFTASVTDTKGIPMNILMLDTAFGSNNTSTTPAGLKVGELRLPTTVLEIGAAAFSRLDNCTNVVNFLPDSVTTIGKYSFYKLPVKQDLSLRGVVNLGVSNPTSHSYDFGSSKITSVTFGPGFKGMYSWSSSPFSGCTSLTNVTFDAAMTDGFFGGIRYDGFFGCSSLAGTVDLSGFSDLSYVSDYGGNANIFTGTKVEHFIVGTNCTKLAAGFFDGDASLKDITFMGPPPTIITNKVGQAQKPSRFFNYNQSSLMITTCIHKADRAAWAPYVTVNGEDVAEVPNKGATWKAEYVTDGIDLSLRPFKVVDNGGLILFVK